MEGDSSTGAGPAVPRVAGYLPSVLGMVLAVGSAHAVVSHALLGPLTGHAAWLNQGPRTAVWAIVGLATLIQGLIAWQRAGAGHPDQVTRFVPLAARLVPPLAAAACIPIVYDAQLLDGDQGLAAVLAPVAVTWSSALLIALIEKRVLHAVAIRLRTETLPDVVREVQTASLAGSMGRVLGGAVVSLGLLMICAVIVRHDFPLDVLLNSRSLVTITGLIAFAIVCAIAGVSLGESPGRDVTSIARRLDALGYNTRHTMAWPVVVTSFDDLGVLFNQLERLRARLAGEVALYQDALDKTRDADAAKAEFLGAVSHELRTPLNSVIGFAQLLIEGTPTPLTEAQAEDVRLIRTGGYQLLALINDILAISMIESGELSLSFSPEDMGELMGEIAGIHQPLVRDKDLKLEIDVADDLPRVVCDRRRIGQVITNLISNAIKFTEEGSVTLRARQDPLERTIMVSVIDSGVGIAEDEVDAIFQEYRQVGALKRRAKGTGLGLAIARSIAQHHGGSLSVRSELGEGSAFTLTLPISPVRRPSKIDMTKERIAAVGSTDESGEVPP